MSLELERKKKLVSKAADRNNSLQIFKETFLAKACFIYVFIEVYAVYLCHFGAHFEVMELLRISA